MAKIDRPHQSRPFVELSTLRPYRKAMLLSAAALIAALPMAAASQPPAPPPGAPIPGVDFMFNANVKRVFDNRCVSCHGADRQMGGLRLDSREAFLKGGAHGPVVAPGNRGESRLYTLISTGKMPLDAGLSIFEVESLGQWIDAGAPWPDVRKATTAVDPRIEAWRLALRAADRPAIARLARDADLIKVRGQGGSTALHYAARYGTLADLKGLLDRGATADAANDKGETPLMWAMADQAKAKLLIDRGANVNAMAADGTSVLLVASAISGGAPLVTYLLDHGARVDPNQAVPIATVLASTGEITLFRALFPRAMDPKDASGPWPFAAAAAAAFASLEHCADCLDYVLGLGAKGPPLGLALTAMSMSGDAKDVKRLLDLGATTTERGPQGATALMAAANAERDPVEKVTLLLAAGADATVADANGRTAMFYARLRNPAVVPLLAAKGAK